MVRPPTSPTRRTRSQAGSVPQAFIEVGSPLYERVLGYVLKELERQREIAPELVVKIRLYKHYHMQDPGKRNAPAIAFPWMVTHDTIAAALGVADRIAGVKDGERQWLTFRQNVSKAGSLRRRAKGLFERKRVVADRWLKDATSRAGTHGEKVVRAAMVAADLRGVPEGGLRVQNFGGSGKPKQIDAVSTTPALYVEVKNKMRECYPPPSLFTSRADMTEDVRQIDDHFRGAHRDGVTPVLVAPMRPAHRSITVSIAPPFPPSGGASSHGV